MATNSATTPPAAARQSSPSAAQRSSTNRPRRNYMACVECKNQKIKCQLGSPDDPQPPCARCRRSRLDCVFGPRRGAVRGTKRKRATNQDDPYAESHLEPQGGPAPNGVPSVGVHAPAIDVPSSNSSPTVSNVPRGELGDRSVPAQFGHANTNHTTSSATLSYRHLPSPWDASAIENDVRSQDLSDWSCFQLCREGWISPVEAEFLLQCYFNQMQPMFPVVEEMLREPLRRASLLAQDYTLCLAILTVASRYAWFEGTHSSSRAHEIHSLLFKRAQQSIQQSLWGVEHDAGRESRVLSTIESILLFVEWRPRPLDVMPNRGMVAGSMGMYGVDVESGDPPTGQTSIIDDETQKAYMLTRRMNATSWRLLGHAVNLADEIDLVEGLSRPRETHSRTPTDIRRRARIRDLLVPLTWEVSFRLGRSSFLKLPKPSSTTAEEYGADGVFSPLLSSRAELYRLCRLVENTLYSSNTTTKDIIASDRHPEMISSLAEILHDWWKKFQQQPGPTALRKCIEIQYHNVWTFLHAIAFQAIIERLRGLPARGPGIQHFERSYRPQGLSIAEILRSERSRRDIQLAEEIAKSSVRALEVTLELEQEGYLRMVPFTTMTWILTSATLLLKGSGLRAALDPNTTDVLNQISTALYRAVVDDVHMVAHYTSSLSFLIRKIQTGAATSRAGRQADQGTASSVTQPAPTAINLPPIGAENTSISEGNGPGQPAFAGSGGLFNPVFPDDLAEDWVDWLSTGLGDLDGSFGFDLYSSCGFGEVAPSDAD